MKNDEFCSNTHNVQRPWVKMIHFVFKTRSFVSKTRNSAFKNDEFCRYRNYKARKSRDNLRAKDSEQGTWPFSDSEKDPVLWSNCGEFALPNVSQTRIAIFKFKTVNFVLKMMNFVFKNVEFCFKNQDRKPTLRRSSCKAVSANDDLCWKLMV